MPSILVCPAAFKGSIGAVEAADALARGAAEGWPAIGSAPGAEVVRLPVSDGGDGLIDVVHAVRGGRIEQVPTRDPLGREVAGRILLVDLEEGPAAVVESADACGLHLLAEHELDPLRASSAGLAPLVRAAAERARTVVVGLGGSATIDGGAGMAAALGWRLLDADGAPLSPGGGDLHRLARIEPPARPPLPPGRRVVALADVGNALLGAGGAVRVYGPQKGAAEQDLPILEAGLARLAEVAAQDLRAHARWAGGASAAARARAGASSPPGLGAAGGLGLGCVVFLGARLVSGASYVLHTLGFDEALKRARIVVTGEGRWDAQSSMGKATGEVVRRTRAAGVPTVLIAGRADGNVPADILVRSGSRFDLLTPADLERMAADAVAEVRVRQ